MPVDRFRARLNGQDAAGNACLISLPFYHTLLSEIAASRRKRVAMRRTRRGSISRSAGRILKPCLLASDMIRLAA